MQEFINHRKMTEFGNIDLVEDRDEDHNDKMRLPGVKKGDMASRVFKPEVRVSCVRFCPTGSFLKLSKFFNAFESSTISYYFCLQGDHGVPLQLKVCLCIHVTYNSCSIH